VTPEEFEEVCFGTSLVLRAKATGPSPVYYVLGETFSGGRGYPVTARDMTAKEKRRYADWKRR